MHFTADGLLGAMFKGCCCTPAFPDEALGPRLWGPIPQDLTCSCLSILNLCRTLSIEDCFKDSECQDTICIGSLVTFAGYWYLLGSICGPQCLSKVYDVGTTPTVRNSAM